MTTKEPKAENVPGEMTHVKSPHYRSVYSNQARITASPWDFRATFSHIQPDATGVVTEEEVTVVMSPQHAKAFLKHWESTLSSFEKTYGEIVDPSGKLAEAQKQSEKPEEVEKGTRSKKAKTPPKIEH